MARLATAALAILVSVSGCVAAVDFSNFSRPSADPGAGSEEAGALAPESDAGATDASKANVAESGADALPARQPIFVQSQSGRTPGDTAVVVNLQPLGVAGDLLIVAVGDDDSFISSVASVEDDNGDVFVSANQIALDDTAGNSDEIWYTTLSAGAKQITVNVTKGAPIEIWALEVRGVTTLDAIAKIDSDGVKHTSEAAAKVTPTVAGAFIVSVGSCSIGMGDLVSGSPFQALEAENGNDVAWAIAPSTDPIGAEWNLDGSGTSDAVVAAFR